MSTLLCSDVSIDVSTLLSSDVSTLLCRDVSTLRFTDHTLLRVSDILRQLSADGEIWSSSVEIQLLASLSAVLHSLSSDLGLTSVLRISHFIICLNVSCKLPRDFNGCLPHREEKERERSCKLRF